MKYYEGIDGYMADKKKNEVDRHNLEVMRNLTDDQIFSKIDRKVEKEVRKEIEKYLGRYVEEGNKEIPLNEKSKRTVEIDFGVDHIKPNGFDSITYNHVDFDGYEMQTSLEDIFTKYNLNKSQIAEMVGINRGTLNNIIKDPNSCSLLNAYKLSMTFDITIEKLFKYVLIE
jgi:putative transcriptional regulator